MDLSFHQNSLDEGADTIESSCADEVFDLAAVVRQYEAPLLRYVEQLIGTASGDAQDVVQDAFLRLHRQVTGHGESSVKRISCWLFRVAHNLAMDAGRRRARRKRLQETVMADPVINPTEARATPEPAAELGHREACRLAMTELGQLPDEQRNVLLLKIIQGFTLREISDVTGMKIGTVNYRLTQGLRELSARLRETGAI